MKPIHTYEVTVVGFPPMLYSARSPGKARSACWRDYGHVNDSITFAGFLAISTLRRVENPPGVGDRIMVGGLPATRVISHGQYISFMHDDSDTILHAHPADVTEIESTPP